MAGTDIGTAYVHIVPSAEGISGNIKKAIGADVDSAGEEAGQSFGAKFASVAAKAIAALGVGKMIGEALNQGGQLQQSMGGIETLFKDSADKMMQYASESFRTTGLSANEYMQNVTGFSASLLQSLGGNTDKAAEISNMAMIDMADNANKMGTSMETITAAYQGFARQQYQMLDSLRLGYGGTKSEMERLLADAEKISGVHYDISNLSDVYEAIHVIQTEIGITGTTALEASQTLEGSFNAMKAAFMDLLGQIALGGDITTAFQNLTDTVTTYLFGNFLPMIGNVLTQVPQVIGMALTTGLPILFEKGMEMITFVSNGVAQSIPTLLAQGLPMVLEFVQTIRANIGQMVDAGIDMILKLVDGLIAGLPDLIAYVPEIVTNIAGVINDNMPKIFGMGIEIIGKLIMGLANNLPNLLSNMGNIMMAAWNVVTAINWLSLGSQILKAIINGIKSLASSLPSALKSIAQSGWNAFKSIDWAGVGSAIINGIVSGIYAMGSAIKNALMGLAEQAWASVKNFFGIKSPSKLMADTIGKNIPLGMAEGIEDNAKYVTEAMESMASDAVMPLNVSQLSPSPADVAPVSNSTNYGGVNINIMAEDYNSAEEIFEYIKDRLTNEAIRQNEVFA